MFTVQRYSGGAWSVVGTSQVAPSLYQSHLVVVGGEVYVAQRVGSIWRCSGGT